LPAAEKKPGEKIGGGQANGAAARATGDDDSTRTAARLLSNGSSRAGAKGDSDAAMLERAGVAMRVDQNAGEAGRLAGRGDTRWGVRKVA
jgi:hypothetical protein